MRALPRVDRSAPRFRLLAAMGKPVRQWGGAAQMMIAAVVIAVSLTVMAATGVLAMAMYVAASDEDRYTDEDCIP